MLEQFQDVLKSYLESDKQTITVAYSGGVDSTALLHLAKIYCDRSGNPLSAIYINHGLSPNAVAWQEHCQAQCARLDVDFIAASVQVTQEGQGLEAAARTVRYEKLAELTDENSLILLGQHADDQIETFFLQLMRGAGVDGLSAMPVYKKDSHDRQYLRPLLGISREEIEQFANAQSLQWIEDESNADDRFDRNYLRNQVLPLIKRRWPQSQSTITRSIGHIAQHSDLMESQVDKMLLSMLDGERLNLEQLLKCESAWHKILLKHWFKKLAVPQPSSAQLQQLLSQSVDARIDSTPVVKWENVEARVYDKQLYLLEAWSDVKITPQSVRYGQKLSLEEQRQGLGEISIIGDLDTSIDFEIQFEGFGRKFKPPGASFSKPLSQWFKIWKVPPWLRGLVPLVCVGENIISVGNAINHSTSVQRILQDNVKVTWRHHFEYTSFPFAQ